MTNKYEVKYYNMYNSETKVINLYKNDELIEAFAIDGEVDIQRIHYADAIKNLVRNCYYKGLKAETEKRGADRRNTEDYCSFMRKTLTEYDIRYFYNRSHDINEVKERCAKWDEKIGQKNDYSEIFKRVTGGN